ncbi:MAG: hydantoinase/oxoprolinase family protein [Clostridiales bacterium]|nr:hydantoinase/oxoprolinase family protein [Clostridiales bacterium]
MKIGIGIDTGGTYTDAVVYDFDTASILGSAKALTTKDDLSIGILNALDGLSYDLLQKAEIISLSTTLATNACVEDRGGRAKLIFFGGDKKVIDENGSRYGLPPSGDMYIQESYTNFSGETAQEPDWELFKEEIKNGYDCFDGVGIIEMNAMKNGAATEKKAKALFNERYNIPVICGHELFSELNSLQRGASTLLNARLFPVIKEFLEAIKKSVSERKIDATLIIVRSDGSMMDEKFASVRPVETLLCGPAASTIGGHSLCREKNSIIIDMGGTTTDIALVRDNLPVTVVDGVSIGKWKTFVNGLYVKTFGLGGDSAVHYDSRRIFLEDYRVVPLCVAADQYPVVIDNLRGLLNKKRKHTMFLYEHFTLIKDIKDSPLYTDEEKGFCRALTDRPLMLEEAATILDKDIYNLNIDRLIKDGVVQICGLTPTDIMHIRGDFNRYSKEASMLGAEFAAFNLGISIEDLCDRVYIEAKRKIYMNVVKIALENKYPHYMKGGIGAEVERIINEGFESARKGNKDNLINIGFNTEFTLVGIGAPIRVFLDDVADMLNTKAFIPENYEVANALGAIVGNVSATHTIEIRPMSDAGGIIGYTVYGNDGRRNFKERTDAETFAISEAKDGARVEATNRGAKGDITVTYNIESEEAEAKDCNIYLGTTVTAHAVGASGF